MLGLVNKSLALVDIVWYLYLAMEKKKEIISQERRTDGLVNMSGLLMPLAKKMLGKKAFAEADVICNWQNIVGEDTASFSRPLKIEFKRGEKVNGCLYIETLSGAAALELQMKTKLIIEKVNTFFGYGAVQNIKILQNLQDISVKPINNHEKILVSKEEESYIESAVGEVKNKNLAEALQNLGRAVIKNNKK